MWLVISTFIRSTFRIHALLFSSENLIYAIIHLDLHLETIFGSQVILISWRSMMSMTFYASIYIIFLYNLNDKVEFVPAIYCIK